MPILKFCLTYGAALRNSLPTAIDSSFLSLGPETLSCPMPTTTLCCCGESVRTCRIGITILSDRRSIVGLRNFHGISRPQKSTKRTEARQIVEFHVELWSVFPKSQLTTAIHIFLVFYGHSISRNNPVHHDMKMEGCVVTAQPKDMPNHIVHSRNRILP